MRSFDADNSVSSGNPGPEVSRERIPDHLVDAFFDGDLTRQESAKLFNTMRADPKAAREIVGTQRALDALRAPVHTPDLSRRILADVHRRTPLLTRRSVRHVRVGRMLSAAALVAIVAGAFIAERLTPQLATLGEKREAPIANLATVVPCDTADAMHTLRETAMAIRHTTLDGLLPASRHVEVRFVRTTEARPRTNMASLFPWLQRSAAPADSITALVSATQPPSAFSCSGVCPSNRGARSEDCRLSGLLVDLREIDSQGEPIRLMIEK